VVGERDLQLGDAEVTVHDAKAARVEAVDDTLLMLDAPGTAPA